MEYEELRSAVAARIPEEFKIGIVERRYYDKINYRWVASATYDDGTSIEADFPYTENGIYSLENIRQHKLEE